MYRQQQEVRGGGAKYSTELAGRDRFKFFRRPVEPSGGELHAGGGAAESGVPLPGDGSRRAQASTWNSAQIRYAASTPAAPALPFADSQSTRGNVAFNPNRTGANAHVRPRRPASVESPRSRRGVGAAGSRGKRARVHHLPTLANGTNFASTMPTTTAASGFEVDAAGNEGAARKRECGVQTVYRENEAQTDPYSPDYFIPDGAPEPEILKLQGLTYQNGGLPAGKEEVELIQRLRRRREVEAALPTGSDEASIEERFRQLHALEEEEWQDREAHVEHLQSRRLDRIKDALREREAAREAANQDRLASIKSQYMATLSGKLGGLQAKSMAERRRAMDRKMARNKAGGLEDPAGSGDSAVETGGSDRSVQGVRMARGAKPDLIASYVAYGARAAPPEMATTAGAQRLGGASTAPARESGTNVNGVAATNATKAMTYDVRPLLLTVPEGVEEVDRRRGGRIEYVSPSTFVVPEQEAIARLPTLYQRHEAERVVQSLERAHLQIEKAKMTTSSGGGSATNTTVHGTASGHAEAGEGTALTQMVEEEEAQAAKPRSVLDLYRAPPKVQRPATPELELDGDAEEESEEACILLQRLLRGRAVQNDFFEGKGRCRGLIQELQAASDAKEAEQAVADVKELEALARQQRDMVDHVVSAAVGDIIGDTLGYLYQELDRQRDIQSLEALRAEAESVRKAREATELARREAERVQRDREALQFAALVRATRQNTTAFLEAARAQAVRQTALAVAVEGERARQGALPAPRDPADDQETEKENLVCDMLDGFVIPAIVDSIQLQERKTLKTAPGGAAQDVAQDVLHRQDALPS